MRFNISDWLLLVAALATASAVKSVVAWVIGLTLPGAISSVLVMLGTISPLVDGLAIWLVLRRCVAGLRLWTWLLAIAIGTALAAALLLPAWMLQMRLGGRDLLALTDDPVHLLARWLTVVTAGVATFLPPALLLQRLTGAHAWPLIGIGTLSQVAGRLVWPVLMPWLTRYSFYLGLIQAPFAWLAIISLAVPLVSGMLYGLMVGAGLFLMARRPLQATRAADGSVAIKQ